jgi:hypothetical protein
VLEGLKSSKAAEPRAKTLRSLVRRGTAGKEVTLAAEAGRVGSGTPRIKLFSTMRLAILAIRVLGRNQTAKALGRADDV